ncbi:MAG: LptF/LptG family permease [Planctomycetaceae bacterium]|nr:LptF/LptG family permease [Planctomycetaceae bacterium]
MPFSLSILDRYIARQFLINIAVLLVLLGSFVVLVDASLNLQRFLGVAEATLREQGQSSAGPIKRALTAVILAADLWWPRLLQLYNYLVGIVLIGAMGFTFAQLVRHREIVAALAGGISLTRLIRPVLLVAAAMITLQIINQEVVIPRIAPLLLRSNTEITRRDFSSFPVPITPDSQGRLIMAQRFDPNAADGAGELIKPHIWESDTAGRLIRRISADKATFISTPANPANSAKPSAPPAPAAAPAAPATAGYWKLHAPVVTRLALVDAPGSQAGASASATARAPDRLVTDLDPTALKVAHYRTFSQSLSWLQIREAVASPATSPQLREQLLRIGWGRVAVIVCVFLSLLIAIPFFLTREPRNMVAQTLKAAPISIGALLGSILGTAAPLPGLPVEAAVFVPVLALLPMAIAMLTSMKT